MLFFKQDDFSIPVLGSEIQLGWLEAILSEWVSEVTQLCPTLCDPVDCSPAGSSIHGILQARVLLPPGKI